MEANRTNDKDENGRAHVVTMNKFKFTKHYNSLFQI